MKAPLLCCDYCPFVWHLDCLDPPLTSMPPAAKKWMCPAHTDHYVVRRRQVRDPGAAIVHNSPAIAGKEDVSIIREPTRTKRRKLDPLPMPSSESVIRHRFEVPESSYEIYLSSKLVYRPELSLLADLAGLIVESIETLSGK